MLNRLLSKWYFPVLLKYLSLIAFIILVATGLMAHSTDSDFLRQLRNTNLGNLVVWSFWWPIIVILAIFFGRVWCMVCPVEVITTFCAKIGFKRKRPKWLLSGWVITVFYILILFVGIQWFAIHRNPLFMAVYLLVILGVSVLVGIIFEKNTFCRYVCPVGYVLGLYSKLSFFGWRVASKHVCDTCNDKSCIHKNYHYNLNAKSCGVDLYPANINDNADCILCAGCLKTCSNYQSQPNAARPNPRLKYIGFANDLFNLKELKMAEMVLVMVISGYMISQIWSEWSVTNTWLKYLPSLVDDAFRIKNSMASGIVYGVVWFVLVPLFTWSLPYLVSRILGMRQSFRKYLLSYGIAFIPIVAAAHAVKSIVKSIDRIPYIEHLTKDLSGMVTAQMIIDGEIILKSNPFWLDVMVSFMIVAFIAIGIGLSVMVVGRLAKRNGFDGYASVHQLIPITYGGIFLVMLLLWRWF